MNLLVLVDVHRYIESINWKLNPDIKSIAHEIYKQLEQKNHRILALDLFTNMKLNKNITLLFKELISYFNAKAIENDKTIVDPHRFFLDNPYDNFFICLVRHMNDSVPMKPNVIKKIEQIFSGTTNIQNLFIGTNDYVVNKLDSNFTFLSRIFKGQEVVVENLGIRKYSIDKGPIESSNLANVLRSVRGLKRLFIQDLFYEDAVNHYRQTGGAIEASLKILEHSANQLDYIEIRTPMCTLHMNSIWSSLHNLGARNVRLCMIENDPDWTEVGEDEVCSVFESYALEGCLKKLVWENVFSSQAITTILLSQGVQANIEHLEIIHEHPTHVESSYKNRCDTGSIQIYNATIDFIKGCKSCKTLIIPEVFITLNSLKQIVQEYEKSCIETLIITQVDDPQSKTKIVDVLDQFKKDDRPFSIEIKESRVLRLRIGRRSPDHDIHFIKRHLVIISNSNSESSSNSTTITITYDDDDQEMPPLKKIRDDGDQEPPLKKNRKN